MFWRLYMALRVGFAHVLDWFDAYVLRHRFQWVCRLAIEVWPAAYECHCANCRGARRAFDRIMGSLNSAEEYDASNVGDGGSIPSASLPSSSDELADADEYSA